MAILGVGTEIVDVLRIAKLIERHGELFIGRVYTEHEIGYCASRNAATQHYAGRWAAKEAILKALGVGWAPGVGWRDVEVRATATGPPTVRLHGAARDILERAGVERVHVSISHCRTHATAYAIAEG